jgi:NUMOD4 motif
MTERWAWIPGFVGAYQISDRGRVRSLRRTVTRRDGTPYTVQGRILRLQPPPKWRSDAPTVSLSRGGHHRSYFVHLLVKQVFSDQQEAA